MADDAVSVRQVSVRPSLAALQLRRGGPGKPVPLDARALRRAATALTYRMPLSSRVARARRYALAVAGGVLAGGAVTYLTRGGRSG
ncbi:hypothetical protein ABT160_13595 [Streptomyces sp. NPDC001941]|uniref:hypothetical protein n=1 Tax=Streptomyces sp. NPDC001941 TaxID=3154659 RepID=UPI00332FA9FA